MRTFQEHQGCKAFSHNLAHFVNHPPCHGRDLPPTPSGTHGFLSGVFLLFRLVKSLHTATGLELMPQVVCRDTDLRRSHQFPSPHSLFGYRRKHSPGWCFPYCIGKSSSGLPWCRRFSAGATQVSTFTVMSGLYPKERQRESRQLHDTAPAELEAAVLRGERGEYF